MVLWIEKIRSPWIVMFLSIILSELIFITIGLIFLGNIPLVGFILSFIIPAVTSYPISSIMLKSHLKIKAQKEELEQLNLINQKLFSTISHDIRSPLATASMFIDVTLSDSLSMEESKVHLKEASKNITVLLTFLDELLSWSKDQLDKKPLQIKTFNSDLILNQTIQLYGRMIKEKNLNIELKNSSALILADIGSYSFAFRNALQNAIKYTPDSGDISIDVIENGDTVKTIIKDSGVGMTSEKIESILSKKFYKSSKGTNEELGTGFGLRTAIGYLESQKGEIQIRSEVNSGTEVSINLPKAV